MWEKGYIHTERGEVLATKPVIISASRATDIPAFYSRWFMDKLRRGYVVKINPFNGRSETISFEKVRVIVFWSKFPLPMMRYLDDLDSRGLNYYFLFTLNDYPEYELGLPNLTRRIEVFRQLSDRIAPQRVLWRYDPLILSDKITQKDLLTRIENIGKQLNGYTQRLIFSFVDTSYRKVINNLRRKSLKFYNPSVEEQLQIVRELKAMAQVWNMDVRSCASTVDFSSVGVEPNKCIDDELMVELFSEDKELMSFLGYNGRKPYSSNPRLKDKGQRKNCKCIYSKDIGQYDTCLYQCVYCYAKVSHKKVLEKFKQFNYKNESI